MYGLMFLTYKTANKPVGILSAFAFTGFLGYILGPILNAYLSAGMGDVIGLALGGTALVFFCCSAYVLTTRKDMSFRRYVNGRDRRRADWYGGEYFPATACIAPGD